MTRAKARKAPLRCKPAQRKAPPRAKGLAPLTFADLCTAAVMLGLASTGKATADQVSALLAKSLQQGIVKRENGKYHLA